MAISNIQIRNISIILLAAIALVLLLVPSKVGAAGIPAGIKFGNEAECNAKLATYKNDDLKAWGKTRVESRAASLSKYRKDTDAFYVKQQARIQKFENSHKKTTGANSNISTAFLKTNNDTFNKEITTANSKMNSYNTALQSSKDSKTSAQNICKVMYELRINTYVSGKAKHLRMIDSSRTTATINNIRISESTKVFDKRKSRYESKTSAEKLVNQLPKSLAFENEFVAVTKKLNEISPASINANTPPKANQEFLGYLPELNTLTEKVKTQTGSISKTRSDLKKEKLKPVVKKKKATTKKSSGTTSGGQSLGGGSSNGGTAAP